MRSLIINNSYFALVHIGYSTISLLSRQTAVFLFKIHFIAYSTTYSVQEFFFTTKNCWEIKSNFHFIRIVFTNYVIKILHHNTLWFQLTSIRKILRILWEIIDSINWLQYDWKVPAQIAISVFTLNGNEMIHREHWTRRLLQLNAFRSAREKFFN